MSDYLPGARSAGQNKLRSLKHKVRLLASKLAGTLTLDKEAQLIDLYGTREQRFNAELYRATCCVEDDEEGWGRHVSSYLSQFGLCPVTIAQVSGGRFARLASEPGYEITDGPKVSVLIAAHNAATSIDWAVASILKQTWRNLEVIVVDDASSDETWPRLNEIALRDRRIQILRNRVNVGPFVSRNRVLPLASGAYITGHDADDWAHPQRIERQVGHLVASPGSVAIANHMIRLTENLKLHSLIAGTKRLTESLTQLHPVSSLIDSEAFKQHLGHWDSVRFSADGELFKRAQKVFGAKVLETALVTNLSFFSPLGIMNHPIYGHRIGRRSLSPTRVEYRNSYGAWHRNLRSEEAYIEFPLTRRKFMAPSVMLVDAENVRSLLEDGE